MSQPIMKDFSMVLRAGRAVIKREHKFRFTIGETPERKRYNQEMRDFHAVRYGRKLRTL